MKVDSKTLLSFLKKISVNGEVRDCIMVFDSQGLNITVKTPDQNGAFSGLLSAAHFSEYAPMRVTVKDLSLLISILADMNGLVDMSVLQGTSNSVLYIASSSTNAKMPMMKEDFVTCKLESLPTLEHDGGFVVDAKVLASAKKYAEKLKTKTVKVSVKDKKFMVTAGEEGFNQVENLATVDYRDVESFYGEMFLKVINALDGIVTIAFDKDYPLLISQNSEDGYSIRWLVSPATESEPKT